MHAYSRDSMSGILGNEYVLQHQENSVAMQVIRGAVKLQNIAQFVRSAGRVLQDALSLMGELFYFETVIGRWC